MKKSIFGLLLMMEAIFLAVTTLVALYYHYTLGESDWKAFALTTAITLLSGATLTVYGRAGSDSRKRQLSRGGSFIVVGMTWVVFSAFGMLPFIFYEGLPIDPVSAYFETMNGFTTTGATVLSDLESLPHGILFWRSLMQWLGGLGIVVFSFALLPVSDMKNSTMFQAETTGITLSRLTPKIGATARRLLLIYLLLTAACAIAFWAGPMNLFDALNHSMTAVSTGGFSTHSASIGYFQSAYVEYVTAAFMFISSINFYLLYYVSIRRWQVCVRNEELQSYVLMFVGLMAFFCLMFRFYSSPTCAMSMPQTGEEIFRTSFFHVSSIFTSTSFTARDFVCVNTPFWFPTMLMMIIGGCAGSTSGGVKVVRVILYMKHVLREFRIHLHPRAIISIRMNGHVVPDQHVRRVMSYLVVYVLLLVVGSAIFSMLLGYGLEASVALCIASFSNVGSSLGELGLPGDYASLPAFGKIFLSLLMLIGRLEIFTVLFLFMPKSWRL